MVLRVRERMRLTEDDWLGLDRQEQAELLVFEHIRQQEEARARVLAAAKGLA
jgi:hypothetical protein